MEVIVTKQNNKTKNLTEEQMEVIQNTYDILNDVLDSIYDTQDICLSHIKKLDDIYWKLKYEFLFVKEN